MDFVNPIVPYSHNGWQLRAWYNYIQLTDTLTLKVYEVSVYGNQNEVENIALSFKSYLEKQGDNKEQVSIGLKAKQWDEANRAFVVTLVVMRGQLYFGSRKPKKKKHVTTGIVVNHSVPVVNNGIQVIN